MKIFIQMIFTLHFTFQLNSINIVKECTHDLWNRNMMKIFIRNVIVCTQFTFKLNSLNTVKEGIHELWNRNMMKIFIPSNGVTLNNGVALNTIL